MAGTFFKCVKCKQDFYDTNGVWDPLNKTISCEGCARTMTITVPKTLTERHFLDSIDEEPVDRSVLAAWGDWLEEVDGNIYRAQAVRYVFRNRLFPWQDEVTYHWHWFEMERTGRGGLARSAVIGTVLSRLLGERVGIQRRASEAYLNLVQVLEELARLMEGLKL